MTPHMPRPGLHRANVMSNARDTTLLRMAAVDAGFDIGPVLEGTWPVQGSRQSRHPPAERNRGILRCGRRAEARRGGIGRCGRR